MPSAIVTVLTTEGAVDVDATVDGERLLLDADALLSASGWEARPEGLCRGDVCVPVRDPSVTDGSGRLDLAGVASALRRPLALELDGSDPVAVLGDAADDRGAAMATLAAPPFVLPGLDGTPVSLDAFADRKRLLLAWASW